MYNEILHSLVETVTHFQRNTEKQQVNKEQEDPAIESNIVKKSNTIPVVKQYSEKIENKFPITSNNTSLTAEEISSNDLLNHAIKAYQQRNSTYKSNEEKQHNHIEWETQWPNPLEINFIKLKAPDDIG